MINEKEIIEIISDLIKQDISTKLKGKGTTIPVACLIA